MSNKVFLVIAICVACVVFFFGICFVNAWVTVDTNEMMPHTVTYVVDTESWPGDEGGPGWRTGGRADITIENGTGGTEQHDVTLPWKKEFSPEPGQFLYLSAQSTVGYNNPGVQVSILLDGRVVRHASSGAQYGIASVSARMP